jgi:hypothetical protein
MEKAFDLLDRIETNNEKAKSSIKKIRKYMFKNQLNDKLFDKLEDLEYIFDKDKRNKKIIQKIIKYLTGSKKNKYQIVYNQYPVDTVVSTYNPYSQYIPGQQPYGTPGYSGNPGNPGFPPIQGIPGTSLSLRIGDMIYVNGNISTNDYCTGFEGPINIRNINAINKLGTIVRIEPPSPTTPFTLYCIQFQDPSQGKYGIEITADKIIL